MSNDVRRIHAVIGGRRTIGVWLLAVPWLTCPAVGGTGTARIEDGRWVLDFCVSIRFDSTSTQRDDIREVFTLANQILADATDDKVRFGRISIFTNSNAGDVAEVWIHSGNNQTTGTVGLYGVRDEHIKMYITDFNTMGSNLGVSAHTVAHEFGHHLWDLRDEYISIRCNCCAPPVPPASCAEFLMDATACVFPEPNPFDRCPSDCEPSPGSDTSNFCLMDNYKDRGGGSDNITLNEFCVTSNHDPDADTAQQEINGGACWKTLDSHQLRKVNAPIGLPDAEAPANVPDPDFVDLSTRNRFVLCLDRSGSMQTQDAGNNQSRFERAQQAASAFISLTRDGDQLGITSFDCQSDVPFPLTEIAGNNRKDADTAVANSVVGGDTSIARGLVESRELLAALSDSCNQSILLLSDGKRTCGPDELDQIALLAAEHIPTSTVAIGDAEHLTLALIAILTGGRFYHCQEIDNLGAVYAQIEADLAGDEVIRVEDGELPSSGVALHPIAYDSLTDEHAFVVTWTNPAASIDMTVFTSTFEVIDENNAGANPRVDYRRGVDHVMMRIRNLSPPQGDFTGEISLLNSFAETEYTLTTIASDPAATLGVGSDRVIYECGEAMTIYATPRYQGHPVRGVDVTVDVVLPSGLPGGTLTMHDDGLTSHGDGASGDGTYSAKFTTATAFGAHTFIVQAINTDGETAPGETLFPERPPHIVPTRPFERRATVTLVHRCLKGHGDLDGDCDIDLEEVAVVQRSFLTQVGDPQFVTRLDFDQNGILTLSDFALFLDEFGRACPPVFNPAP